MKRYLLFGGDHYYARGGLHDFVSSHDTLGQALKAAQGTFAPPVVEYTADPLEWWHIFDRESAEMVAVSESQAYGVDWGRGLGSAPPLKEHVPVQSETVAHIGQDQCSES